MRGKRLLLGSTIVLSIILSFVRASSSLENDSSDYQDELEDIIEETEDFILENEDYEYVEVIGEDAQSNVIPFYKHPGVYVLDLEGVLYALDEESGDILWSYRVCNKMTRVVESRAPPPGYSGLNGSTSLQSRVNTPFNEMLVSLDGYILIPRVDGKFSIFQHSIDNIVNSDAVSVKLQGRGEDSSLYFTGSKKSFFIELDAISGKQTSFGPAEYNPNSGSHTSLSWVKVLQTEKNVNCLSNHGFEFWNLTTTSISLKFSDRVIQNSESSHSIDQLLYSDGYSINALDKHGDILWRHHFPHMLMQSYYANNGSFILVRYSPSVYSSIFPQSDGIQLLDRADQMIKDHVLNMYLVPPTNPANVPLLDTFPRLVIEDLGGIPSHAVTKPLIPEELLPDTPWQVISWNQSDELRQHYAHLPRPQRYEPARGFMMVLAVLGCAMLLIVFYRQVSWYIERHYEREEDEVQERRASRPSFDFAMDYQLPHSMEPSVILEDHSAEEAEANRALAVHRQPHTSSQFSSATSIPVSSADFAGVDASASLSPQQATPIEEVTHHSGPAPSEGNAVQDPRTLSSIVLLGYTLQLHPGMYHNEFIEQSVLGSGGFGSVFLATKRLEHKDYAVKRVILRPKYIDQRTFRVLREVRVFAKFDHLNVVRFYNSWLEFVDLSSSEMNPLASAEQDSDSTLCTQVSTLTSQLATQIDSAAHSYLSHRTSYFSILPDITSDMSSSYACDSYGDMQNLSKICFEDDVGGDDQFMPINPSFNCDFMDSSTSSSSSSSSSCDSDTTESPITATTESPITAATTTASMSPMSPITPHGRSTSINDRYALVLYIQMAYCGRRTLNHYLEDVSRSVEEEEILKVCVQLCQALGHIHLKQVIHRDVKPANIFYGEDGLVRLGDFGLSRDMSDCDGSMDGDMSAVSPSTPTPTSYQAPATTNIGTYIYASPEQFTHSATYDYKSDIWSAGMVLYEMTFPAFVTKSERFSILDQPRQCNLEDSRPGISPPFFALIKRMLSIDPALRPTAEEAVAIASMILEGERAVIIQVDRTVDFNEQRSDISSELQKLEISRFMKQIRYDADNNQIIVILSEVDRILLEANISSIVKIAGVTSAYLSV